MQPVGDGPRREQAGENVFVFGQDLPARHIQHGEVLPGEGQRAVLPDGAAAHRDLERPPLRRGLRGQAIVGLQDGAAEILGDVGLGHDHLDLLAHLQDGLGFDDVRLGLQALEDVEQPVRGHEVVEGAGGDREAARDEEAGAVVNLCDIGVLFAHDVRHLAADRGMTQDEIAAGRARHRSGLAFDGLLNPLERLLQPGVGPARHLFDALDHPAAVEEGPHGLGLDVGQPEGGLAPQFLLDVRNDLEQLGVGFQEQLEVVVLEGECRHPFLPRHAAAGSEQVENRQVAEFHGATFRPRRSPSSGVGARFRDDGNVRLGGYYRAF